MVSPILVVTSNVLIETHVKMFDNYNTVILFVLVFIIFDSYNVTSIINKHV